MQSAFSNILERALPDISVIFWDLDGTLGEQPGWSGKKSLSDYVIDYREVKKLLKHLKTNFGIYNVLVSRNGMFCGDLYDDAKSQFENLGFDEVFSCYRTKSHSKVYGFANLFSVLLIDDQMQECIDAQEDGACALHIGDVFQRAVPEGNFAILFP